MPHLFLTFGRNGLGFGIRAMPPQRTSAVLNLQDPDAQKTHGLQQLIHTLETFQEPESKAGGRGRHLRCTAYSSMGRGHKDRAPHVAFSRKSTDSRLITGFHVAVPRICCTPLVVFMFRCHSVGWQLGRPNISLSCIAIRPGASRVMSSIRSSS